MRRREFLATLQCAALASPSRPEVTLRKGEYYFRVDGRPAFLLGRNPAARRPEDFETLFRWALESGEKLVRIHVVDVMRPSVPPDEIDEQWAIRWERVFDMAAANGLSVLPVLGVWAQWNDGSNQEVWHSWDKNTFNAKMGGPAHDPAELFADTRCRKLWLRWLEKVAARWQSRWNILGWEVFSELDLATGAQEGPVVAFVELAAHVLRRVDARRRPITASLSELHEWPRLYSSDALDFLEIHPYRKDLCDSILTTVHDRRRRYRKPIFIGESGLVALPPTNTLATSERAAWGIRHAIWASAVSGAMNGRMLWWEDGYDVFEKLDLRTPYRHAAAGVAQFVKDVDYGGFEPLETKSTLRGGAIGNHRAALGWFHDPQCVPPEWPVRPMEKQTVELTLDLTLPENAGAEWKIAFYNTETAEVVQTLNAAADQGRLHVPLPPFQGSIAFAANS